MKIYQIIIFTFILGFCITSCKKDDSTVSSGDDIFTAKVDGEPYVATEIYGAGYNDNGNLFIVSATEDNTIELEIIGDTTGTYQITGNSGTGGLYTIKATSEIYSTDFGGSAAVGTIYLNELTSTRMAGTFSFNVSPIFATRTPENTIEITDGEFNVAFR